MGKDVSSVYLTKGGGAESPLTLTLEAKREGERARRRAYF